VFGTGNDMVGIPKVAPAAKPDAAGGVSRWLTIATWRRRGQGDAEEVQTDDTHIRS